MKKVTYLVTLIFAMVLINSSCEKDNNSESVRLRLTKIADNKAMENPFYILEYNSDGHLSQSLQGTELITIEYSNDKPVKLTRTDIESPGTSDVSILKWTSDGFTITGMNYASGEVYLLNSQDKIETMILLYTNSETQLIDTFEIVEDIWTAESQLKKVHTYYPPYSYENEDWEENFSFGTGNSPFKGINIALVVTSVVEWSDWVEPQNIYCTTKVSDKYDEADVVYEFNDQNFPIKADIKYKGESIHDYVYFEYESY